jgi:hypothetical protein
LACNYPGFWGEIDHSVHKYCNTQKSVRILGMKGIGSMSRSWWAHHRDESWVEAGERYVSSSEQVQPLAPLLYVAAELCGTRCSATPTSWIPEQL